MTETTRIELVVKDASDAEQLRLITEPAEAGRQRQERHFLELLMKESMDQHRSYGALRAVISWLPVLIVLYLFNVMWKAGAMDAGTIRFMSVIVLAIPLALVFWFQRRLERYQYYSRLLYECLQRRYLGVESELIKNLLEETGDANIGPRCRTYQELIKSLAEKSKSTADASRGMNGFHGILSEGRTLIDLIDAPENNREWSTKVRKGVDKLPIQKLSRRIFYTSYDDASWALFFFFLAVWIAYLVVVVVTYGSTSG